MPSNVLSACLVFFSKGNSAIILLVEDGKVECLQSVDLCRVELLLQSHAHRAPLATVAHICEDTMSIKHLRHPDFNLTHAEQAGEQILDRQRIRGASWLHTLGDVK